LNIIAHLIYRLNCFIQFDHDDDDKEVQQVAIDTAWEKVKRQTVEQNNNSQKNAENKGDAVTTKEVRLRQGNRREKNDLAMILSKVHWM
jgi:hypothetical protein